MVDGNAFVVLRQVGKEWNKEHVHLCHELKLFKTHRYTV